jgi:hypothetical protein
VNTDFFEEDRLRKKLEEREAKAETKAKDDLQAFLSASGKPQPQPSASFDHSAADWYSIAHSEYLTDRGNNKKTIADAAIAAADRARKAPKFSNESSGRWEFVRSLAEENRLEAQPAK